MLQDKQKKRTMRVKSKFPKLPTYPFSWRSVQLEPIPGSGERITVGTIVKGDDNALLAARLIPSAKMRAMYGVEFGRRITDALKLCIDKAEEYYASKPITSAWRPALEGFYLGDLNSSVSRDLEDALMIAAMHSSSFSVSIDLEKLAGVSDKAEQSGPGQWRKSIFEAVTVSRSDLSECFDRAIAIRGSGVPIKFGFVSDRYAAQFEAISDSKNAQSTLVRAQSKLWQLDMLRDQRTLFGSKHCELLMKTPELKATDDASAILEVTDELKYEASRRDISLFVAESANSAATHLIDNAA